MGGQLAATSVSFGKMLFTSTCKSFCEMSFFSWAQCYFHLNQGFEDKEVET